MIGKIKDEPSADTLRTALDGAWADHHHTRDQTWKSLEVELGLGGGLLGIGFLFDAPLLTAFVGILVVIVAACGIMITVRHRNAVERRCFIHITKLERALGLPLYLGKTRIPSKIRPAHVLNPFKNNTSLFILRMHIAILVFAVAFVAAACCKTQCNEESGTSQAVVGMSFRADHHR
jgi:hypothetical protein